LALGGTATAAEGLQALVSSAGSAVQRAQGDQEYATLVTDQLVSLRESVSGVSTDEEMIALSRYQSAYQASVRVVEVTNLLLEELMGMAR
jgi:flagellar hook-associated protein 1 FlgK